MNILIKDQIPFVPCTTDPNNTTIQSIWLPLQPYNLTYGKDKFDTIFNRKQQQF